MRMVMETDFMLQASLRGVLSSDTKAGRTVFVPDGLAKL